MSDVPAGWQLSNLEHLAKAMGGGTPSKSEPRYWTNGDIPWVSPKDMKTRSITGAEDSITRDALKRLSMIPENSVLVVVRSGILSRTLPVATTMIPVTINQDMRAFHPDAGISHEFLAWQLIANEREILAQCSKDGTTVASIEGNALAQFPIRVAPRAEQTRIVEKLEELLGGLDAAVAELQAAQRKLALYRQSLLKAAVEGALTADWRAANGRPQEPAAELLQRILHERRSRWEQKQRAKFATQGKPPPKGWQAKYPEPVAPDTTGLPELPEEWVWASVEQLGDVTTGCTPSTSNPDYFGGGIPFFKPTDLDAGYELHSFRESLTELGAAQGRLLPANSVLVTCIGATIGKTGLARVACTTNQQINAVSPADGIYSEYFFFVMASPFGQHQVISNASATTLPILNKSKFEKLPIPLPPLEEQRTILEQLDTALTACDAQQAAIAHGLKQAAAQRRNLLKAAFAGQLVPQDPGDEPASALLARIREAKIDNAGRTRAARNAK